MLHDRVTLSQLKSHGSPIGHIMNITQSVSYLESPETFGFVLLPGFPLAPLASAIDVLALANYVSQKTLYSWNTVSTSGESVEAMNGLQSIADWRLNDAPEFDAITVCSGIHGNKHKNQNLQYWLRDRYSKGARIGSISTGSWTLARTGILRGKRCTIHWEDLHGFQETYPTTNTTSEIFEVDGRIFTCSGGSAATDMFLSFVAAQHGVALAITISEQLVHGSVREGHTSQRLGLRERTGISEPTLIKVIELMELHLEEPMKLSQIASQLSISSRYLERMFRKYLGRTPQLYYRELRLRHSQNLLRTTSLSIQQIAHACGFCTSSYFAKCYIKHYKKRPGDEKTCWQEI